MDENNNEKLQELAIIIQDKLRGVGKWWWYAPLITFVLCFPLYYLARTVFVDIQVSNHKFPSYVYQEETKQPLQVIDKKIFNLGNNSYTAYIRIKNVNLEWGVPDQVYTAVFHSTGGTEIATVSKSTYVLPGSEKIVVIPRFTSDKEPTILDVTLGNSNFVHKPDFSDFNFEIQRKDLSVIDGHLTLNATIKNNAPFIVSKVDLPVLVYGTDNQIIGVNYTNIDNINYQEARSFQIVWPNNPAAVRAEILPQVNLFDTNIYNVQPGQSQFDVPATTQ